MSGRRLATRNALEPALHHRSAGRAQGVQGHHRGHDARRAAARPPGARLHAGVPRLARRTRATPIALTDTGEDWSRRDGSPETELKDFGAVLMRKAPPFDMEYVA